ncbi:MAG: glycosyltransferase, partial [Anaerolineae bacterium]|nr:glycosyltransferase [Anaerolineae bacterium]
MTVETEILRPLLVSVSEQEGGAARASQRLYSGLRASGIGARLLVQSKSSADPNVIGPTGKVAKGMASLRPTLDQLPLLLTRKPHAQFMTGWFPDRIAHIASQLDVNVINLHEIRKGNLRIESLNRWPQPIVWTLHDLWPLTGGCHYDEECGRYRSRCGNCPILASGSERDLSRQIMRRKMSAWQDANLTVVAPSHWIANCARQSTLFASARIEMIPNGLDTTVYRPLAQRQARDWLGLPQERHLLLFLA